MADFVDRLFTTTGCLQSGSTEARLSSGSSPTCAQCRLRVGYVLVALRYLIEIRRERVISQAIVVPVFVEHSANWSEAAAEAFDHDCNYSPNALHAKKKTAFLTVGRQKSQTTAFDANHWKAILQNIRLVWSQVVGSRIVGSRVVDCLSASRFSDYRLSACRFSAFCLPAAHLAASSWSQVVGSWGRWIPNRCDRPFRRRRCVKVARPRQFCASRIYFCVASQASNTLRN